MRAMWNLMNVMQVVVYLRLLENWSAQVKVILYYIHQGITLEFLSDWILETSKDSFEKV